MLMTHSPDNMHAMLIGDSVCVCVCVCMCVCERERERERPAQQWSTVCGSPEKKIWLNLSSLTQVTIQQHHHYNTVSNLQLRPADF